VKAQSKSGFKDARDKVDYLGFRNYTSNTPHKPKMSRILLKVVLPVFLVLKFDYKCVGDTVLPYKVSVLRDSTPFAYFSTIRSYLQAFGAVIEPTNSRFHIRLVRCRMKALILQREQSSARLAKYVNGRLLLCCPATNYQAYGVNLLGRSVRFELKHHNVYDAHFMIIR
jgi:hypothetical protein